MSRYPAETAWKVAQEDSSTSAMPSQQYDGSPGTIREEGILSRQELAADFKSSCARLRILPLFL